MTGTHAARPHLYLVRNTAEPKVAPAPHVRSEPARRRRVARVEPEPAIGIDTDGNGARNGDQEGDREAVARALCLRALTQRPQTRKELADLLATKGIPGEVRGTVLDRLTGVGLIDDAALAQGYAETRHRTLGLSRNAVRLKLRQRGVEAQTADEAAAVIDDEAEESGAADLVRRRLASMAHLDTPTRARRLVATLARKGYSADLCHRVVRGVLSQATAHPDAKAELDSVLGSGISYE